MSLVQDRRGTRALPAGSARNARAKLTRFVKAMREVHVPVSDETVVISDNADIYGTLADLEDRLGQGPD
ncbi:MAG: hypothetical protein ABI054_10825 [Planctomycetota bacterium]